MDSELVVVDWIMPVTQSLPATARMVVDMLAMAAARVVMVRSVEVGPLAAVALVVIPVMVHPDRQTQPLLVVAEALDNIILAHMVSVLVVVLEFMAKEPVAQHLLMELVMVVRAVLTVVMAWPENLPTGRQATFGHDLQEITQQ